jgi:hypothetical protein
VSRVIVSTDDAEIGQAPGSGLRVMPQSSTRIRAFSSWCER